jgi:hypothetical protein
VRMLGCEPLPPLVRPPPSHLGGACLMPRFLLKHRPPTLQLREGFLTRLDVLRMGRQLSSALAYIASLGYGRHAPGSLQRGRVTPVFFPLDAQHCASGCGCQKRAGVQHAPNGGLAKWGGGSYGVPLTRHLRYQVKLADCGLSRTVTLESVGRTVVACNGTASDYVWGFPSLPRTITVKLRRTRCRCDG